MELFHTDCLTAFRELPADSIDLVLCDPPYGLTHANWDSAIPLKPMWSGIEKVINNASCHVLLFGQNPFTAKLIASNMQRYSYDWIWEKSTLTQFLGSAQQPMKKYEIISNFKYGKNKYIPQCTHGNKSNHKKAETHKKLAANQNKLYSTTKKTRNAPTTQKFPHNILRFASPGQKIHNTEKPIKLLMHLIESYSRPGETVLDFTMGSGSTGIAALATGRKFVGVEINEDIFKKAKRRIELYIETLKSLGKEVII